MSKRTILITGASGGLGAALARVYASPDTTLMLWGRDCARLEQTTRQCRAKGASCIEDSFDLRDLEGQLLRLARLDEQNPIDVAIFNAGIGGIVPPKAHAERPQDAQAKAEVNFVSPIVAASLLADRMAARGQGQILLISSIAQYFPLPMAPTYAASKAGLAMFARAMRIRLAKHGVSVTLVAPGFIDTPMSRQLQGPRPFLITADKAARIIVRVAKRRPAQIILPWQFGLLTWIAKCMPQSLLQAMLRQL